MQLELGWGKLRRAFLKKYRPAYVARMAERRQGECPDCRHDVIDSRDLKYVRNVCGYRFKEEDDPYRWRDHVGLARDGLAETAVFSLLFFLAAILVSILGSHVHGIFYILVLPLVAVWILAVAFFRDPERQVPPDPLVLVSPADGTVTDVGVVDAPDFPGGKALRISIFLSIFNVHVNRVPRSGRVVAVRFFPGAFRDARDPQSTDLNEQVWIDLEDAATKHLLRVKQIAGRVASRVVCRLRPNENVLVGERFGMIKFGSRTEVLLPVAVPVNLAVKIGDKIQGGATILLRFALDQ